MNTRIKTETSENAPGLLQRQWVTYSAGHKDRTNLLIHLFAVPLFILATVGLIYALSSLAIIPGVISLIGLVASLALQGTGHSLESVPPEPFDGALDFARRLLAEQWITFPRFVLSGGWFRNYLSAGKDRG